MNKLAVDVTVDKADIYRMYWPGVGGLGRDARDCLTVILSDLWKQSIS